MKARRLRRAAGRVARQARGDRGERGALSLELALIAPVVMLLLFGIVQTGLYFYARNVALTAAQQGVEAARLQGASLAEGEGRTWDLLHRTGGSITGPHVSAGTSGGVVTITVTGKVDCWIPGISFPINQSAHGAKEQPTP